MEAAQDFIRRQRSRRGLSQSQLAEMAGVSRHTVSDLESGKLANVGLATLESILDALGYRLSIVPARPAPSPAVPAAYEEASRHYSAKYASSLVL